MHDPGGKVRHKIPSTWKVGAQFGGPNNQYRYVLMHRWSDGPIVGFMLMNPSIGDCQVMDPTIYKTSRIARRLGYSGQYILNVCGYRATNKARLLEVDDPVGPFNHDAIRTTAARCSVIVVGHGILPRGLQKHADAAVKLLVDNGYRLHVFKLTKGGVPQHPLYVREDGQDDPKLWKEAA
jgi:hypothetical protein